MTLINNTFKQLTFPLSFRSSVTGIQYSAGNCNVTKTLSQTTDTDLY